MDEESDFFFLYLIYGQNLKKNPELPECQKFSELWKFWNFRKVRNFTENK